MIAFIAKILAAGLNVFIMILAAAELGITIKTGMMLYSLSSDMSSMRRRMNRPVSEKTVKTGQGQNVREARMRQVMDYHADLDHLQDSYEEAEKWYMIFAQIIPIFPLLGILGTVSGLYSSLSATGNMNEDVAFALSSTLLGLFFSIIYKTVNMVYTAGPIARIENGLERYKEEYVVNNENREIDYGQSAADSAVKTAVSASHARRGSETGIGHGQELSGGSAERKNTSGTRRRKTRQRTEQ